MGMGKPAGAKVKPLTKYCLLGCAWKQLQMLIQGNNTHSLSHLSLLLQNENSYHEVSKTGKRKKPKGVSEDKNICHQFENV